LENSPAAAAVAARSSWPPPPTGQEFPYAGQFLRIYPCQTNIKIIITDTFILEEKNLVGQHN